MFHNPLNYNVKDVFSFCCMFKPTYSLKSKRLNKTALIGLGTERSLGRHCATMRPISRAANSNAPEVSLDVVWFRIGDLRVRDHEPLSRAVHNAEQRQHSKVLPIFICPEAETTDQPSIGLHRLQAIKKALDGLNRGLEGKLGLLGHCTSLQQLLSSVLLQGVYDRINLYYYISPNLHIDGRMHREEELMLEVFNELSQKNKGISFETYTFWGRTLFHPCDIVEPAGDVNDMKISREIWLNEMLRQKLSSCETMTAFRENFQQTVNVRRPVDIDGRQSIPIDKAIKPEPYEFEKAWAALQNRIASQLESWTGKQANTPNSERQNLPCGEIEALQRLEYILYDDIFMKQYREGRMQANTEDLSALLSVALSVGSLSPRTIYHKTIESLSMPTENTWTWNPKVTKESAGQHWLLMHLAIRDYFLFRAEIDGERLMQPGGPQGKHINWKQDDEVYRAWTSGKTGFPFVDASMRCLNKTGFISNRSRQNVASFLTKELGLDWRKGAAYFGAYLIDHEPGINLESWAYIAGVGSDPRGDRKFLTVTQGERYDPNATLIDAWVPEVSALETKYKHRPWMCAVTLPDYPTPIVNTDSQIGKFSNT